MSKVRVVARNADGTSCVVMYCVKKPDDRTNLTDDQWFDGCMDKVQEGDPSLIGKPYVDTDSEALPPLDTQGAWQIVDGVITNAA